MILNDIDVGDDFIARYSALVEKVGKQLSACVSNSPLLKKALPEWVISGNTELFNVEALKTENDNLAAIILTEETWMRGVESATKEPGQIDPSKIVLFAYAQGADSFIGLYFDSTVPRLIYMTEEPGGIAWDCCKMSYSHFFAELEASVPGASQV